MPSKAGQQNGSARLSNMLPRRSPLAAQVRRPCWRSCRSCCSLKTCDATLKHCRRGQTGWLAGLRDAYVARALALLHHDIARPWNVDDLSREVGLSRAALANRFISLIGMPPMHYVASWRMQVATQKLRNTSASLAQVADLVGYSSEAAFSRAFKKAFGTAPATWRRSNR